MSPDAENMDKPGQNQVPKHLLHPDLAEDFDLRHRVAPYKKPRRTIAPISSSVAELLIRGHQLIEELDRQHTNLINAAQEALAPSPQAWHAVRNAMTSYTAAYAELNALSKRINFLISVEAKELLSQSEPIDTGVNGQTTSTGEIVQDLTR
jgi:hypothetical protein